MKKHTGIQKLKANELKSLKGGAAAPAPSILQPALPKLNLTAVTIALKKGTLAAPVPALVKAPR